MSTFFKRLGIILLTWPILLPAVALLLLLGLVVVPLLLECGVDMKGVPIWGNTNGMPEGYEKGEFHWYAIRNPINNLKWLFDEPEFVTLGAEDPESKDGFQWQYRYGGWMDMFRITFGKAGTPEGKDEVLLGWKLMEGVEGTVFTTQFRPFWLGIVPLCLAIWGYVSLITWIIALF